MVLCNFVLYLAKFGRTKATADHLIFFEREEKNMAGLRSRSVLEMMAQAPLLTLSQEK